MDVPPTHPSILYNPLLPYFCGIYIFILIKIRDSIHVYIVSYIIFIQQNIPFSGYSIQKSKAMNIRISSDVYFVGANDFTSYLYEALWPIPFGISYNSYIVKGEKIAIVDLCKSEDFVQNIKHVIGNQQPQYIVLNHMEAALSGTLNILRTLFPHITIVGNRKTLEMVNGFYGINTNVMEISDGETLNLGGKILKFIMTPMIHWPETMMTYLIENNILFSGGAFGCFGALNGGVIDADIDADNYIPEIYRYYSNIISKYGRPVQNALNRIKLLDIDYICPAHGPVWRKKIDHILSIYNRLSLYIGEPGVVIAYASMYGNTAIIAKAIASRLARNGIKEIRLHNVSHSHISYVLSDIFKYNGLIIGSPTYSGTIFPLIETLLSAIKNRTLKNRVVASFGSYSWDSQAIKKTNQFLSNCNLLTSNIPSIESKFAPSATTITQCFSLADKVTHHITKTNHTKQNIT